MVPACILNDQCKEFTGIGLAELRTGLGRTYEVKLPLLLLSPTEEFSDREDPANNNNIIRATLLDDPLLTSPETVLAVQLTNDAFIHKSLQSRPGQEFFGLSHVFPWIATPHHLFP